MKKFLCAAGFSLLLLNSSTLFAADNVTADKAVVNKVAVVDIMRIFQEMPEGEKVKKDLEAEFSERAKALQAEEKVAQSNAQKLQKENLTLPASEKKKLQEAIMQFENKANEFTQERRRREGEEANKLYAKIADTIQKIAEKEHYSAVIRAEATVYFSPATDITQEVLKQVK